MDRNRLHVCILFVAAFLLCALGGGVAIAQETPAADVRLVSDPVVDGDQVTLKLEVRDSSRVAVPDLTASSFTVSEPHENLEVSTESGRPLSLVVIADLSLGSDVDLIQNTLRAYFGDFYQPDDQVTFYILGPGPDGDAPWIAEPGSLDEINALIDGLRQANRFYSITELLQASAYRLLTIADPDLPHDALYVGSLLNRPDEAQASRVFANQKFPFHVVQAHRSRTTSTPLFRALAVNGGGLFADNAGGELVAGIDRPIAIGALKLVYEGIANSRTVYVLRYNSRSASADRTQTARVTVTLADSSQASAEYTYERQVLPPLVELVSTDLNPARVPSRQGDSVNFDVSEQAVVVAVTFPDGTIRTVKSLQLEVFDAFTGAVLQSESNDAPQPDSSGNYTIAWPLDAFDAPQTTTRVQLVVTATDELGLSGSVSHDGSVTVSALPTLVPTVPPTIAPTVAPTATVQRPTPAGTAQPQTAATPAIASSAIVRVLIAVIALLVGLIAYLLLSLRRSRRSRPVIVQEVQSVEQAQPVVQQPQTAAASTNGETQPDQPLFGRLIVINGLSEMEIRITSEEFVIGRKTESGCDYVIDEPYISPRHCMLIHRSGNFTIRDLGAKNGTFVNGERIPRERDVMAPIGSEIGITRNITLELWDPQTVINLEEKAGPESRHSSHHTTAGELSFRPVLGIKYVRDDDEVPDDYSPV